MIRRRSRPRRRLLVRVLLVAAAGIAIGYALVELADFIADLLEGLW